MLVTMKRAFAASVYALACFLIVAPAANASSGGVSKAVSAEMAAPSGVEVPPAASDMPSPQDLDNAIRSWILAHPEVILQSLSAIQAEQSSSSVQGSGTDAPSVGEAPVSGAMDLLPVPQVTDAADLDQSAAEPGSVQASGFTVEEEALLESMPVVGNPDGDVTVLQFFDYQCRYCKATFPEVVKALNADGKIRMVMMEWPILGPTSVYAAQAALAAHRQGPELYVYFHNNLMSEPETLTREKVDALATKVGLDLVRLKKDMEDPEIEQRILLIHRVARQLDIRGTPTFLIGRDLLTGGQTRADFEAAVAAVRTSGGQ